MPISRRQFFGQFLGSQEESAEARLERLAALESSLQADLLPYDFTLSEGQTSELFEQIHLQVSALTVEETQDEPAEAIRKTIKAATIQPWREAHWKADELRSSAAGFVREFLATEASEEDLHRLRHRFNIPYAMGVDEEVERHARCWLEGLPDARILEYDAATLRSLVFSELRS
jgi:hypothetical protein